MRTTLPWREARFRGGELSQAVAPDRSVVGGAAEAGPPAAIIALLADVGLWGAPDIIMALAGAIIIASLEVVSLDGLGCGCWGWKRSTRRCSRPVVLVSERRVRMSRSRPKATATTPARTAMPRIRRIHSSAPRERFMAAKTRSPARRATVREVAAPAA